MKIIRFCLAFFLPTFFAAAPAVAEEIAGEPAVLMELFTSQGCYSCPPADDLLREAYRDNPQLLPLELHVNYWDELVYGFAGKWKDPFSSQAYTNRQRAYNLKIRRTPSMYTPQIVVQGRHETVGTRRETIDEFVAEETSRAQPVTFYFSGSPEAGWSARLDGALQGNEDLYTAVYIKEQITDVSAGENKDKRMINTNIIKTLSREQASRRRLSIPPYDAAAEACAVWLQKPQTGAVIAAARCPMPL